MNELDLIYPEETPWHEPVDGTKVLNELRAIFKRYMWMPDGAADALALWVVHTHCLKAAEVTPYIAVISPEPECGKSTLLGLLAELVHRPEPAASISSAAIFRTVDEYKPTLLIDELDAFLKGNSERIERMRGLLNSGYTRRMSRQLLTEEVVENGRKRHRPVRYSAFCPKALAKIGDLPETLMSRSIVLRLERAKNGDYERLTRRQMVHLTCDAKRRVVRWARDHLEALMVVEEPAKMPRQLGSRAFDRWCPLIAIADEAEKGGPWSGRARHVARLLEQPSYDKSVGEQLLTDVRDYCDSKGIPEFISSTGLLKYLLSLDRWQHMDNGKPLTSTKLGCMLGSYHAPSKRKKDGRGFGRKELQNAFDRYLDG